MINKNQQEIIHETIDNTNLPTLSLLKHGSKTTRMMTFGSTHWTQIMESTTCSQSIDHIKMRRGNRTNHYRHPNC